MTLRYNIRRHFVHASARRAACVLAAVGAATMLAGCAQQRVKDSSQELLRAGAYEQALDELRAGVKAYPDSAVLRAGLVQTRAEAISRLLVDAQSHRAAGRADLAEKTLQRAKSIDPANERVDALMRGIAESRLQDAAATQAESLLADQKTDEALRVIEDALRANPRHSALLALQRRALMEVRQSRARSTQMSLAETRPISLDFRDTNLRTVLDAVTRHSGVNFVLDKDIRSDTRITIYLKSAKVEEAIDLIVGTHQLSKKVIDSQTLLIYPNTPEKQREHQEQVVKVFYLASADAKGAAAFLKSMLKIKDPYVDERTNMLSLRESQENIQLAERLISLYDTADAEVLLDLEVIEIRTSRLTELGVKLPDNFSLTVLPPPGDSGLTLGNIRGLTRERIGFAVDGVTVNLKRETGDFNTLANPRIRVRNKEKAKVLIGDKVPVVSATTSQSGFVSDSISYIDVGLKLDVEPVVYIDDEVAIRVSLEVSSLGSVTKTSSGSLAYQIGTRNASTLLRLRDGETQLLAGLIKNDERSDARRIPGLGDLPVMGRLFSSTRDDNERTELALSITPRILRNVRRPDVNDSELWVGTEAMPRHRPISVAAKAAEPQASTGASAKNDKGSSMDEPAREQQTLSHTALQWIGPGQVKAGDTFMVGLGILGGPPLRGIPIQMAYSRDTVEVLSIEESDHFRQGGEPTAFTKSVDAGNGRASAAVLRNSASAATGAGQVLAVRLRALRAGPAELSLIEANPVGLAGPAAKPAQLPTLRIEVQ